jgi:tRNA threonylcarbamoyladenosine biosynthesis protein TsaB
MSSVPFLLIDENQELFFQLDTRPKAQTQTILPMIEQGYLQWNSYKTEDLSAIAFSRGPGSFSGVRINAAVAQALAWSHDLPVIPVSSFTSVRASCISFAGLQQ